MDEIDFLSAQRELQSVRKLLDAEAGETFATETLHVLLAALLVEVRAVRDAIAALSR